MRMESKNKEQVSGRDRRQWLVENPWSSAAWRQFDIPGEDACVDQCRFNLRAPGYKLKMRKRTRFRVASSWLAERLSAKCRCPVQRPRHHNIEGGTKVNGKNLATSSLSCGWTLELCNHLLEHVEAALGWSREAEATALAAEIDNDDTTNDHKMEDSDLGDEDIWEDRDPEELPPETILEDKGEERRADGRPFDAEIRRVVRKLHRRLGHPSTEELCRTLASGGAKVEAIEYAKKMKCGVCASISRVREQPQASTRKASEINEKVGVDIFWLKDAGQETYLVLSMVDYASTWHMARILPDKRAAPVCYLL